MKKGQTSTRRRFWSLASMGMLGVMFLISFGCSKEVEQPEVQALTAPLAQLNQDSDVWQQEYPPTWPDPSGDGEWPQAVGMTTAGQAYDVPFAVASHWTRVPNSPISLGAVNFSAIDLDYDETLPFECEENAIETTFWHVSYQDDDGLMVTLPPVEIEVFAFMRSTNQAVTSVDAVDSWPHLPYGRTYTIDLEIIWKRYTRFGSEECGHSEIDMSICLPADPPPGRSYPFIDCTQEGSIDAGDLDGNGDYWGWFDGYGPLGATGGGTVAAVIIPQAYQTSSNQRPQ